MSKVWLFRVIAISLPFFFFILLELALRISGYGQTIPLFIENPSAPNYLLPRPDAVKRYFANAAVAPNVTIETNFFLRDKPENGLRIFVQGGSTAAGFPFGFGASIAGMLDYRLKQSFPERPVEVVNTALSAVNSYTLLDFADEIIEQQPDAVLIYAGHNEYLGILGVGSAYTAANSRASTLMFLKLKDVRIFQLMQNIYASIITPEITQVTSQSRTTMAKVAKHKNISTDSPIFQSGLEQFEQNMSLLLDKYSKAGIPVLLSTIASNLQDQPPFNSLPLPNEVNRWINNDVKAITEQQLGVLANLSQNGNAKAAYKLAEVLLSKGKTKEAKVLFENARQHDLLRFRAPMEINQIIKRLANRAGVTLVDSEKALTKQAKNNIIGSELMIEHLHPTVSGYFEISDAFYQTIANSQLFGSLKVEISKFQAKQEIPLFAAEEYWGRAKIAGLMADYPFTDTPKTPNIPVPKNWSDQLGFDAYKKKIGWLDIANTSLKFARKNKEITNQIKAVKLISDAIPNDESLALQAGVALIKLNRPDEAPRYLNRVLMINSKNTNAMLAMAHAYVQQQRLSLALSYLQKVQALEPNNSVAKENIPKIKQALKSIAN